MLDVTLPQVLRPKESAPAEGVFLHDHRRTTPSPRYRVTLQANLISLVLAGRKSLFGPGQQGFYDPGTCLLFRKGHCLSADLCPTGNGYHSLLLFFDDAYVTEFRQKYRDLLAGRAAPAQDAVGLPLAGDAFIAEFGRSLARALEIGGGKLSARQQRLRLEQILLHLVEREGRRIIDFLEGAPEMSPDERLRRVVEQHALANLTLADLAFLCHMSTATFKRGFTRLYGASPGRWFKARLLDHAAHLLRTGRLGPGEVYLHVGFSSPSSFTKSFRDYHRVTPKEYQRRSGLRRAG